MLSLELEIECNFLLLSGPTKSHMSRNLQGKGLDLIVRSVLCGFSAVIINYDAHLSVKTQRER